MNLAEKILYNKNLPEIFYQYDLNIPVLEATKELAWEAWWVKCIHGSSEEYQRKEFEQWYNKQLDK